MLPSARALDHRRLTQLLDTVGACAALTQTRADTTSPSPTILASAGNMAAGSKPSGMAKAAARPGRHAAIDAVDPVGPDLAGVVVEAHHVPEAGAGQQPVRVEPPRPAPVDEPRPWTARCWPRTGREGWARTAARPRSARSPGPARVPSAASIFSSASPPQSSPRCTVATASWSARVSSSVRPEVRQRVPGTVDPVARGPGPVTAQHGLLQRDAFVAQLALVPLERRPAGRIPLRVLALAARGRSASSVSGRAGLQQERHQVGEALERVASWAGRRRGGSGPVDGVADDRTTSSAVAPGVRTAATPSRGRAGPRPAPG